MKPSSLLELILALIVVMLLGVVIFKAATDKDFNTPGITKETTEIERLMDSAKNVCGEDEFVKAFQVERISGGVFIPRVECK